MSHDARKHRAAVDRYSGHEQACRTRQRNYSWRNRSDTPRPVEKGTRTETLGRSSHRADLKSDQTKVGEAAERLSRKRNVLADLDDGHSFRCVDAAGDHCLCFIAVLDPYLTV